MVPVGPVNATTASGGSVIVSEWGRPWQGTGAASSRPRLPCPLPPYSVASLLIASTQTPPAGTPTR